jgi:hypothetical protein
VLRAAQSSVQDLMTAVFIAPMVMCPVPINRKGSWKINSPPSQLRYIVPLVGGIIFIAITKFSLRDELITQIVSKLRMIFIGSY